MGCIGQVGPDAYNARRVALAAGLAESTPAYTVNRLCGSGLQAIWSAAMLTDPFSNMHMGVTAENVARKYGVSRQEQDEFALESQRRAASAAA